MTLNYASMLTPHLDKKTSANPELSEIYRSSSSQQEIVERIKLLDNRQVVDRFTFPALLTADVYNDTALFSNICYMALRRVTNNSERLMLLLGDVETSTETRPLTLDVNKADRKQLADTISNLVIKNPNCVGFDLHWQKDRNGRPVGYELTLLVSTDKNRTRVSMVTTGLAEIQGVHEGVGDDAEVLKTMTPSARQKHIELRLQNLTFKPTFISVLIR